MDLPRTCFLIIVTYMTILYQVTASSDVMIEPSFLDELENGIAEFNCSHKGEGIRIRWTIGNDNCAYTIDKCLELSSSTNNRTVCSCFIDSNNVTVLSLQISNISSADHNTSIKCVIFFLNDKKEKNTILYIKVPVKTLNVTPIEKTIETSENTSISLNCSSSYSRPSPAIKWIMTDESNKTLQYMGKQTNFTNENGLTFANNIFDYRPNRTVDGWTVFCIVLTTDVQLEEVQSSFITLNITYPPESRLMINGNAIGGSYDVIENETGTLNCTIAGGNPKPFLTWNTCFENENYTRWSSFLDAESQTIMLSWRAIPHTNRNCTCMSVQKERNDSVSIDVNVQYSATVVEFFVDGHNKQRNVTINENDKVVFVCNVDSNPISDTSIRLTNGTSLIWALSNSLNYTIETATCLDTDTYYCHVKNNIGNDSKQQLYLFVRCSPRANPKFEFKENITSVLNGVAVLHFPILAYPIPDTVTWQKYSNSDWIDLALDDRNINISRSKNNSSLTINNITEKYFGKYRLVITNDIDSFTQNFVIGAKERPKPPTGFQVITGSITDISATVQWIPSFDGGCSQKFVLKYSKANESKWVTIEIHDKGDAIMTYTLNGLSSGSTYNIVLQAVNSRGSSELSEILIVHTKEIPVQKENNILGIVIGGVCGVAGVGAVILIFILWYLRKRRVQKVSEMTTYRNNQTIGESKRSSFIRETQFVEYSLEEVDDVPLIEIERTEYCNSLDRIIEIDKIRVSELFHYVLGQSKDDFAIEFQQIPTELQSSTTFATKHNNIALNRYDGIFPYDHSRVKIPALPDFFMNACYIDGYTKPKAYIASLGPTEKTSNKFLTFWQMVWYERSDIIVMLTNLQEESGMKCEQYWPNPGMTITYGDLRVSSVKTEVYAEFTIRSFTLSQGKEQRSITQLHYTAWPDQSVPEDTISLIEFRQQVKSTKTASAGPIIVHCSAGIGRTGTLIAFDRLVAEGQDNFDVNIFECVRSMREQRVKMVQTVEQYIYIYQALVCVLCFDSEYLTVEDLCKLDVTRKNMYSKIFQQLKQTVEPIKREEKAAVNKNESRTTKNRPGADIPGNCFRVYLDLNRKYDNAHYINAVYANSFIRKDFFILAQTPLPGTSEDFICMIYQENCTCIVTMDDLKYSHLTNLSKIGMYIPPDGHAMKIGNFKVSCSILATQKHYTMRKLKISYRGTHERGERSVHHFQYTQWLSEKEIPENVGDFVKFVKIVEQYASDEKSRALVHCLKANERSGLFCALMIIMEKLDKNSSVNIANTIRHLRTRRQSAITSMEQLQFCYQAAKIYAKYFGIQADDHERV